MLARAKLQKSALDRFSGTKKVTLQKKKKKSEKNKENQSKLEGEKKKEKK